MSSPITLTATQIWSANVDARGRCGKRRIFVRVAATPISQKFVVPKRQTRGCGFVQEFLQVSRPVMRLLTHDT